MQKPVEGLSASAPLLSHAKVEPIYKGGIDKKSTSVPNHFMNQLRDPVNQLHLEYTYVKKDHPTIFLGALSWKRQTGKNSLMA